jgi:hypothetical protein
MTDTNAAKEIVRARENSILVDQSDEAQDGETGHREPVHTLESHDAPGSSGTPSTNRMEAQETQVKPRGQRLSNYRLNNNTCRLQMMVSST